MLTHINGICLHISAKSRTFALEKERDTNLVQTQIPKSMKEEKIEFNQEELEDIEFCVLMTMTRLQYDEHGVLRAALNKLFEKVIDYNKLQTLN